jgi:hypothetical protein
VDNASIDIQKRIEELYKQSIKENPVVKEGEGTKSSPALEGFEKILKIYLPKISVFERRI